MEPINIIFMEYKNIHLHIPNGPKQLEKDILKMSFGRIINEKCSIFFVLYGLLKDMLNDVFELVKTDYFQIVFRLKIQFFKLTEIG